MNKYLIFSPLQAKLTPGSGYWNESNGGWCFRHAATEYTADEISRMAKPKVFRDNQAHWLPAAKSNSYAEAIVKLYQSNPECVLRVFNTSYRREPNEGDIDFIIRVAQMQYDDGDDTALTRIFVAMN